jgi:HNH endonuclease
MKWPFTRTTCLEWKGLLDDDGYGRVKVKNQDSRAHRAFFQIWHGKTLSPSTVLLHSCDNPRCFNPGHLSEGTQAQNVADMDEKGRRVAASSLRTHCPMGHEYTEANTVVYRDGKRRCRVCLANKRKVKK